MEELDLAVEKAGGGHGQCVSPAGTWNLPCETAFPSRSLRRVGPTTSDNIKRRVVAAYRWRIFFNFNTF